MELLFNQNQNRNYNRPAPIQWEILRAEPEDAAALSTGVCQTIRDVAAKHYPPNEQALQRWMALNNETSFRTAIDNPNFDVFKVLSPSGEIAGVGCFDVAGQRGRMNYVLPEFQSKGVGRTIAEELDRIAIVNGIEEFVGEASRGALPFWLHYGHVPYASPTLYLGHFEVTPIKRDLRKFMPAPDVDGLEHSAFPNTARRVLEVFTGSARRDAMQTLRTAPLNSWNITSPIELVVSNGECSVSFHRQQAKITSIAIRSCHGEKNLSVDCELAQRLIRYAKRALQLHLERGRQDATRHIDALIDGNG